MKYQLSLTSILKTRKHALRKGPRPISLKEFNHIVLKARLPVLRRQHALIKALMMETQRRFALKLRAFAVMPDHVHLVVKVESRKQWADALRFFCGQVALKMKRGKLWAERAWSRIVRAGRDYRGVTAYVWNNPFRAGIFHLPIDSISIFNDILFGEWNSLLAQGSDPPQISFSF